MLDTQELLERQREIQDKISIKLKQSHYKELSNKILDGLDNLLSKGPTAEVRWIWELIQNAKDASIGQNQVKIVIETSNEQVIFSHSGNPFTLDDIFSIVNQTSSKNRMDMDQNIDEDDDAIPETTGKFGTGFITTHLLSRVIYLKSIYQSYDIKTQSNNYRHFQLRLDRSARTLKQFVEEYDRLFGIFKSLADPIQCPLTQFELGDISTSFTYPLVDDHSRGVMEQGLKNFRETAALVLAFNQRIHSIRINEEIYARHEECIISVDCKKIVIINGFNERLKQIILLQEKLVQLAFETESNANIHTIIQKKKDSPGLFSDFPLIGSHEFIFPCIINSHLFWPNEERSSIILKQSSRSKVNQQILNKGLQLVMKFFTNTIQNYHQFLDIENLCRIAIPFNADQSWYQESLIHPYLELIQQSQFIQSVSKARLALNQIVIPDIRGYDSVKSERLYELIQPFYSNMIIWDYRNIQRWFDIFNLNPLWWKILNLDKRLITLNNITKSIQDSKTLSVFGGMYFSQNIDAAERYLEYFKIKKIGLIQRFLYILSSINQDIRNKLFSNDINLVSFSKYAMNSLQFNDISRILEDNCNQMKSLSLAKQLIILQPINLDSQQTDHNHNFRFWVSLFDAFTPVKDVKNFSQCLILTVQEVILTVLCSQIHQQQSLSELQQRICIGKNNCTRQIDCRHLLSWIENLYNYMRYFTPQNDERKFYPFKVFLNQNRQFRILDQLSQDVDKVDEVYKDLLTSHNDRIREYLLYKDLNISSYRQYIKQISFRTISDKLTKLVTLQSEKSITIADNQLRILTIYRNNKS